MRRFLRWMTRPLWFDELSQLDVLTQEVRGQQRENTILGMNLNTLVELFREKQGKIGRLQGNYRQHTRPLREDLREERPMGNLQDHLNLLASAQQRLAKMRKHGFPGKPSDGTVEGVPFDQPNKPVDRAWG